MVGDDISFDYDVAIVGGGPGGSTTGTLLKKYMPELKVLILERERFPREHVGESQLPEISKILEEMGAWDKVEAANFPIKVGATYKWGRAAELWDFEFLPIAEFIDEPRPAHYAGQRLKTAFQVDRAIYDEILLNHAGEFGCEVRQETPVERVLVDDDRVAGLRLPNGEIVRARFYVDASGNPAIIRRALNVPIDCPTALKNIAIWDYWENAEWAVEIGVGGTRIQILSVGFGWLWFIPLGPTRTSIGLVCPAEYYKSCQKSPRDLYHEAVQNQERVRALTANATCGGNVRTTNDWSFLADRTVGPNWFLVGESAGFADPILSAGLTLTHVGAREAAYTIVAIIRREHDAAWLKKHYDENQRRRIRQHMQFADFWYASNGQFTELQEHCQKIADGAGMTLTAKKAWAWIAQGGFTNDVIGQAGVGGLAVNAMKHITQMFLDEDLPWKLNDMNVLKLNLEGATKDAVPVCNNGKIEPIPCYFRSNRRMPITGVFELVFKVVEKHSDIGSIMQNFQRVISTQLQPAEFEPALKLTLQVLEVLIDEEWIVGSFDARLPRLTLNTPRESKFIHKNTDAIPMKT